MGPGAGQGPECVSLLPAHPSSDQQENGPQATVTLQSHTIVKLARGRPPREGEKDGRGTRGSLGEGSGWRGDADLRLQSMGGHALGFPCTACILIAEVTQGQGQAGMIATLANGPLARGSLPPHNHLSKDGSDPSALTRMAG